MEKIPQTIIDQILDRVDICEIIGEHVQLKRAGRNFKACCPFHNEKTPSFVVSSDKQIYHCFGCGAGGNAIGFLMQYDSLSFPEAVKVLADRVHIVLPKYDNAKASAEAELATKITAINDEAAGFYQKNLKSERGKEALEYIKKRGINQATIEEFRLGMAFDEWDGLKKYCVTKSISTDSLRTAGLCIQNEKRNSDYDRFRNRIIFPIFNEKGSVVAFGARVMDDSLPKYINSPDTPVYNKSNVMYGLNFSKKGIKDKGYAIIVEGYLDVIIPYQHGINNVVAASGTALTERHIALLKRYTDTVVMIFDADKAGESASLRGLDIVINAGLNVRIATLSEGDDPDSFVRKYGAEKFLEAVNKAKDLFEYKLDLLIKKYSLGEATGKSKIAKEMLPTISKVQDSVLRAVYLRRLAERLNVPESSIQDAVKSGSLSGGTWEKSTTDVEEAVTYRPEKCDPIETHLMAVAIMDKMIFERINEDLGDDAFNDPLMQEIFASLSGMYRSEEKLNVAKLVARFSENISAKDRLMTAIEMADICSNPEKVFKDCVTAIRKAKNKRALNDLNERLRAAKEARNDLEIIKLIGEIDSFHKKRLINGNVGSGS
ncbi:MAG TPA: DNA primase [Candidatus Omnitrophota bacterium]|nr:DNA primase [Candidatus Omnitrophota bacterium]HPS20330.1 DNA primase [Candidatus Omnitrophota bacterium]